MKRTLLAVIATALLSITASAAFATDYNLNSNEGNQKFWRDQSEQRGSASSG